jgi:hypothetical protein
LAPSLISIGIGSSRLSVHALVPPAWVESTVGAAIALEAGGSLPVVVSASVFKLVKGELTTMFLTKLKALAASFLIVSIVGLGAGVMARQDSPSTKVEDRGDGETAKQPGTMTELAGHLLAAASPSWDAHRIVVVPGAKIHLRVETNNKKVTTCEAVVRADGRLRITEDFVDLEREGRTRSEFTGGSIVISSEQSPEQAATKEKPAGLFTKGEDMKTAWVRKDEPFNHENRLRAVEQKLQRVLELLESNTGGKHRFLPDTPKE